MQGHLPPSGGETRACVGTERLNGCLCRPGAEPNVERGWQCDAVSSHIAPRDGLLNRNAISLDYIDALSKRRRETSDDLSRSFCRRENLNDEQTGPVVCCGARARAGERNNGPGSATSSSPRGISIRPRTLGNAPWWRQVLCARTQTNYAWRG